MKRKNQDSSGRALARNLVIAFSIAIAVSLSGCGKSKPGAEGDANAAQSGEKKKDGGEASAKKDSHSEGEQELTLTTEEAERAGVKVEEIKAQAWRQSVVVTATIQPDQDRLARVSPRIEGRIISAPIKLGDRVRAGQTLAVLDSVEVGEAHAAWVLAQSELRIAETDFKRAESLNDDEIIPRKDFLRAQSDRDKAAAALRAAADRLHLLGGNTSAPSGNVSSFTVSAPFAGTVIEKKVTLGELANPSEPMYSIADLGRVWIQADLPEAALAKVRVGANAKVSVPAYPGETFTGRIGYLGAALDKGTRTVAARIEVTNADGRLKPEMFATAVIEVIGDTREVIALPDTAIVLMQGRPTVFVFDQGAYETREVETGERIAGRTVLKSGVKAGDQVVTEGAYALKARKLKSQLGHGH